MRVSVIIPFQKPGPYLLETLRHVEALDHPDLEVILLPDEDEAGVLRVAGGGRRHPLSCQATGRVSPAVKRDIGAKRATGDLLAFIDDDAYPDGRWLAEGIPSFSDESICAVGGPQLTPATDSFWQKVSGATFLSVLNGSTARRYWPAAKQVDVDDWPSVNLIVRRADFERAGGFDSEYWPGEDTKLCLDLTHKLGKRIVYCPRMVVYHHRRGGLLAHLKQVGTYGLHRGFFAKRFPGTSLRPLYLVPSVFSLFAALGWLAALVDAHLASLYALGWVLYAAALAVGTAGILARTRSPAIAMATIPYTVCAHWWYGWRFLWGLLWVRDLRSSLGR